MQFIGKLDKEKMSYFKNKIVTDEVIMTDERIKHVKIRHLSDYEKFKDILSYAIKEPDYICKDKNNNDTIFMLKSIEDKNIQVVVKLQTNTDLKYKKNSILTFWSIRKKNYEKVIKNNEIIYNRYGRK